jgi:hemerythrin
VSTEITAPTAALPAPDYTRLPDVTAALAAHAPTHDRDAHRLLVAQAEKIRNDIRSGRLSVTLELMRFLKAWLANHILSADMAYSRTLAA